MQNKARLKLDTVEALPCTHRPNSCEDKAAASSPPSASCLVASHHLCPRRPRHYRSPSPAVLPRFQCAATVIQVWLLSNAMLMSSQRQHVKPGMMTGLTWSRFLLTTCCHTFRSSSTRTGLMRKSTAPCVTPRRTTLVSPLEDITATQVTQHLSLILRKCKPLYTGQNNHLRQSESVGGKAH